MKFSDIDYYEVNEFLTEDTEQPFHLLLNKDIYDYRSRAKVHQIFEKFHGSPVYNELETKKGLYEVFVFPNSSLCWQARLTIGDKWTYHGIYQHTEDTIPVYNPSTREIKQVPANKSKLHQLLKNIRKK